MLISKLYQQQNTCHSPWLLKISCHRVKLANFILILKTIRVCRLIQRSRKKMPFYLTYRKQNTFFCVLVITTLVSDDAQFYLRLTFRRAGDWYQICVQEIVQFMEITASNLSELLRLSLFPIHSSTTRSSYPLNY